MWDESVVSSAVRVCWAEAALGRGKCFKVTRGHAATFGRDQKATLHTGSQFLSRRAGGIRHHDSGLVTIENLSTSHELVVRPWGSGASGDVTIPLRSASTPSVQNLNAGVWWVRNGRMWLAGEKRFSGRPTDEETTWLQVTVPAPEIASVPAAGDGATQQVSSVDVMRLWELSLTHWETIAAYFSEFLACPPSVEPAVLRNSDASELAGRNLSARKSEILKSASGHGYRGEFDAELLAWMVRAGCVSQERIIDVCKQEPKMRHLVQPQPADC